MGTSRKAQRVTRRARVLVRILLLAFAVLCFDFEGGKVYTQDLLSTLREDELRTRRSSFGGGSRRELTRAEEALLRRHSGLGSSRGRLSPSPLDFSRADAFSDFDASRLRSERNEFDFLELEAELDREKPEVEFSAFERQVADYGDPEVDRPIVQFGYDVFKRRRIGLVDAPVGKDYVLGTGDVLVVSIWGSVDLDQDFEVLIGRDGQVRLPLVGPVALKGYTVERAESVLKNRFDELFQNYSLQVGLGRIRDMTVHVVGRVEKPGRVRVASISTLFDAIAAARGVSKDGSLRRVVLRREGEEDREIDFYSYLIDGGIDVDVHLRPNDRIVVPAIGSRVAIAGRVLRPAIYELDDGKATLEQVLGMAGGYARLANRRSVQVESSSGAGRSVRRYDLTDIPSRAIELRDGDVVVVRENSPQLDNVVYLAGNVAVQGRFAFREGMRIADVVTEDSLMEAGFWTKRSAPYVDALEDYREFEDDVDDEELDEEDPADGELDDEDRDRRLAKRKKRLAMRKKRDSKGDDEKSKAELEEGEEEEEDSPGPVLADLPEPFLEYALLRRIDPKTKQETRKTFNLGKAIFERDPDENHLLQAHDTIVIFSRRDFQEPGYVYVEGAVFNPDKYELFPGMRILDVLRTAGGLRPEAYLERAILTRIYPDQDQTRYKHISIDLNRVLAGDREQNLVLEVNDRLTTHDVPEYRKTYKVKINGEVRFPGAYTVIPGERLSGLITRAGGFTREAYMPAASLLRESVRKVQKERLHQSLDRLELEAKIAAQSFVAEAAAVSAEFVNVSGEQQRVTSLVSSIRSMPVLGRLPIRLQSPDKLRNTPDDVELMEGDELIIPRRPEEVHVVGAVYNRTALLYVRGVKARDYLEMCGGATESALVKTAFIIRADGTTDSSPSARRGYMWDPERGRYARGDLLSSQLHPGDTLVIPYDLEPKVSRLGLTKTISQVVLSALMATGILIAI